MINTKYALLDFVRKTQSCQDAEDCVAETFSMSQSILKNRRCQFKQNQGLSCNDCNGFSIDVYNKSKNTVALILKITTWRKIYRILIISKPLSFLLQLKACLARKKNLYLSQICLRLQERRNCGNL